MHAAGRVKNMETTCRHWRVIKCAGAVERWVNCWDASWKERESSSEGIEGMTVAGAKAERINRQKCINAKQVTMAGIYCVAIKNVKICLNVITNRTKQYNLMRLYDVRYCLKTGPGRPEGRLQLRNSLKKRNVAV